MIIRVRGSRGTISISSRYRQKYGCNTACVEVDYDKGCIFFDAGTGLASFSDVCPYDEPKTYHILLSHLHYDHIAGLPFFKPLYKFGDRVILYSQRPEGFESLEEAIRAYIRPPFLPFELNFYKAMIEFRELEAGMRIKLRQGYEVETFELNHPGSSLAYKLLCTGEGATKTMVYATDSSELSGSRYIDLLRFVQGTDLLLHDAFFTKAEMLGLRDGVNKTSWGHSSFEYVVKLAVEAGVKKLGLFHHLDSRLDEDLDEIEKKAQALFSGAFCAYDYQLIDL